MIENIHTRISCNNCCHVFKLDNLFYCSLGIKIYDHDIKKIRYVFCGLHAKHKLIIKKSKLTKNRSKKSNGFIKVKRKSF